MTWLAGPDLSIGIILPIFSSLGKIPWERERLIIWMSKGLSIFVLFLRTEEGRLSHPVAQFFKFFIIRSISCGVHGDRKILVGHLCLIKEQGSIEDAGIFLSRTGPTLVKKLLNRLAIKRGSSVGLPLIVKAIDFYFYFFFLLMTSLIIIHDFLRFCWFCARRVW